MENEIQNRKAGIAIDKVVFGLVLLAIGIVSFGAGIDLWNARQIVRLWPLIPIVIGLSIEVESLRHRRSDGGAFLLAFGVWMLFGTLHLFDLTMRAAMPLGVMVFGLFLVIHAIVDLPETKKEKEREHSESV